MTRTIIDKDFGILTVVEDFHDNTYLSGKTHFRNCNIDIHFRTTTENVSISQRLLLRHIDKCYEDIIPKIHSVLPKKMKEEKRLADSSYFNEHFRPKAIMVSNMDSDEPSWSITLQSLNTKKHFLSVDFKGMTPIKSFLEK